MNSPNRNDSLIYIVVIAIVGIVLIAFPIVMFTTASSDVSVVTDLEPSYIPQDDVTSSEQTPIQTAPDTSAPTTADTAAVTTEPPSAPVSVPTVPADFDPILAETPDAGQEYIDKLVFLGDSTTYGLRYYAKLSGGKETYQVWTPKSGTLALFNISTATIIYPESEEEEQITIREALTRKQPEYLVITLGVNGIASMKESVFKTSYAWLIDMVREVSPNTRIICQTMFPVASNYASLGSINNEKIQNGNKWILDVAKEKGVKYLDTYSVLVGSDGWLPATLQNGDGLHLNSEGFDIELNNLRTHAYPN